MYRGLFSQKNQNFQFSKIIFMGKFIAKPSSRTPSCHIFVIAHKNSEKLLTEIQIFSKYFIDM